MVGRGLNGAWPVTDWGEFDHGQEVGAEFFVAGCDAPELFD